MEKIESGNYYHIYNRGNNKQNVFFEEKNYDYFLNLIYKYLLPISEIYCYCLLPNHFHLLLHIKNESEKPSQQFSNLFNAYTKAITKAYNRSGSLFQKPFKRIKILNEDYLKFLVLYIHLNPEKHQVSNNFSAYKYSSFSDLVSQKNTEISKNEVIDWFEDIDNFRATHQKRKIHLNQNLENLYLE